jgi:peptidoglycan/LPS O-acetylase OafA/YrhL
MFAKIETEDLIMATHVSSNDSANLDVLRSIAVLLVFLVHFYDIRTGSGAMWGVCWHLGQLGVMMFFVHTSLVLMRSLERSQSGGNRNIFLSFYVRRAMRIYPLSIVLVLFAYLFDARWMPVNLWQNITLTQYLIPHGPIVVPPTVTPIWSLPLEMEMYLLLPLIFIAFRGRVFAWLACLWAFSVYLAWLQPKLGEGFTILHYMPCFLGGVVAWQIMRKRRWDRLPGWSWPIGIGLAAALWMASAPATLALCTGAFGILLGVAIPLFSEIRSTIVAKTAKIIARYSYGIYLTHFSIMLWIMDQPNHEAPYFKHLPKMPMIRQHAFPIHAMLIVGITALASFAMYHAIEEPGIEVGRRVAGWIAHNGSVRNTQALISGDLT